MVGHDTFGRESGDRSGLPLSTARAGCGQVSQRFAGSGGGLSLLTLFPSGVSFQQEVAVHGQRMATILTIVLLALALLTAACGALGVDLDPKDAAHSTPLAGSMKGYELYSWQVREVWYFSLLVGTNRLKAPDEVFAPETRLEGLERELDKLPEGEQVFWSAQRVWNTTLPPDEMIDAIRAYCRERGILLEIERVEATRPRRLQPPIWRAPRGPGRETALPVRS